jgi:outer membrane receptor protein involved in Fe transport
LLDPSLNRNDFADAAPDTLSQYLVGFGFNSDFTFQKYSIDDKFLYYWGKDNEFSAGAGVDFMKTLVKFDFNLDPQLRAFFNSNPNIRAVFDDIGDEIKYSRYRAWAQNKFAFGDKIIFQPGLRFDYYDILEKGYLAPRVSLAYAFNDLTTLRAAWGIYYQSPGYEKLRDGNKLLDFDKKFTTALQAEHSIHYVLSLERWLSSEWRAKVDGYYKKFDDLIVPKQVTGKIYETELIPGKNPALKSSWIDPIVVQGDSLTQIPVNNSFGKAYGRCNQI